MIWFLMLITYGIALGFIVFTVFYIFVARAYQTVFGRHFIAFMASFVIAFVYSLIPSHDQASRVKGWVFVCSAILVTIWIQVYLLVSKWFKERRSLSERVEMEEK